MTLSGPRATHKTPVAKPLAASSAASSAAPSVGHEVKPQAPVAESRGGHDADGSGFEGAASTPRRSVRFQPQSVTTKSQIGSDHLWEIPNGTSTTSLRMSGDAVAELQRRGFVVTDQGTLRAPDGKELELARGAQKPNGFVELDLVDRGTGVLQLRVRENNYAPWQRYTLMVSQTLQVF